MKITPQSFNRIVEATSHQLARRYGLHKTNKAARVLEPDVVEIISAMLDIGIRFEWKRPMNERQE